jgi:hypothetical protein
MFPIQQTTLPSACVNTSFCGGRFSQFEAVHLHPSDTNNRQKWRRPVWTRGIEPATGI